MLRDLNELKDYAIHAADGDIGRVDDCYFDDETWTVRYLIVETGNWLSSRKVLISPISIHQPNWAEKTLPVSITKEQVKDSPDIDTDKPVSRQYESLFLGFYGYPMYWGEDAYAGMAMPGYASYRVPPFAAGQQAEFDYAKAEEGKRHRLDDTHLRSCNEVDDYHIHAIDGEIGHVVGFLLDDETWSIRYLVVDTSNWWLGHQALIAPQWIESIRWTDRTVNVDLTRQAIKESVPYDRTANLDRQSEIAIFHHYGRVGYWVENEMPAEKSG
jgi:sporulation protein YlmC with PRC-barrel domain